MRKFVVLLVLLSFYILGQDGLAPGQKYHLVRMDDMGMSHSVNMAAEKIFESGLPVSVSVMFGCPWYQEAVDILKEHPEVCVGIHVTLNSEWSNYRWGPVCGKDAVPSLVDANGYFFPSRSTLFANNPKTDEVEKEIRAQVERAMASGLKIDYMDHHMSAAVETLELRELFESIAAEYGLAIPAYFGEAYSSITYSPPFDEKADSLAKVVNNMEPGVTLQVMHVGLDTPELAAMKDMNEYGLKQMSKHREAEMNSLLSPEYKNALKKNDVKSITYRDLVKMVGLKSMKRPEVDY